MDNTAKIRIKNDLRNYVEQVAGGSANKASKMLKGVSNSYISMILNGKWDPISDAAWRNIENQVKTNGAWTQVETQGYKMLTQLFDDARLYANCYGITGETGSGKTFTSKDYALTDNVFVARCNEFFNRRTFLCELLSVMGRTAGGYSLADMMATIISHTQRLDHPLIILDEVDKLNNQVLYFFISLYNALEGKCGFILMATDFLFERIERGVRLNKKGYKEIFSRLGRKFIALPVPSRADIALVCKANGVYDELIITEIFNKSEGDLRRVEKMIHAHGRKQLAA